MSIFKKSTQLLYNRNNVTFNYIVKTTLRRISTNTEKKCMEIEIPVPWGKIAAKWWGPVDQRPIVCLHGWQDNCNSFDRLIDVLPDQSYLAIDYPGHGKSSQLPKGMFYYPSDVPLILRRIHKYFGWSQISIFAHSLGANLAFLYAAIYPDDVDLFIAFDGLKPLSKEPGEFMDKMANNIDIFLKYDSINNTGVEQPSYTKEMIGKKLHKANFQSIDIDKSEIIYKRNIAESKSHPGKYYFTRDIRLKTGSIICWQHEDLIHYIKRVKCPMLMIRTVENDFPMFDRRKHIEDAIRIIKENNNDFHYQELQGKHHAHFNEPENMLGFITKFLKKYDKSDRNLGGKQKALIVKSRNYEFGYEQL